MKKSEFNQSISIKLVAYDRVRADGSNTIYLRITIDRKKKEINLKCYWPKKHFDEKRQIVLARHPKDNEVEATNLVLEEAKGRANRIKLRFFTDGRRLTLDQFAKEFETFESRDNFLFYWENKLGDDYNNGIISPLTLRGQTTNLNYLKSYVGSSGFLSMGDLNTDFVKKYFNWLMKRKDHPLKYNSALKAIKTIQTYHSKAKQDGFSVVEDAFSKSPKSYRVGEREVLEQDEVLRLIELYNGGTLDELGQEVLRKFLFSCYTGLRISDSAQVSSEMIKQGKLTVRMKKGERFGKEVTIKLIPEAQALLKGRKGLLFDSIPDPVCNRWLKIIAGRANIDKSLSFHVSRDTFATLFIESGGDVGTLKNLMGHSSIHTTQIYMKMSEKRADKLMDNMASMFKKKPD